MDDVKKLIKVEKEIVKIAEKMGLEWLPQEFDIISAEKMFEIMAYNFPTNYSHWSFGRDYEMERTKYEHGHAVPYEVVFPTNPSRAYLMVNNPFPVQALVMAHVYGHNDFMNNNFWFKKIHRGIIRSATEAGNRFREYEEEYGIAAVENIIDAAQSINFHVDMDLFIKEDDEDEVIQKERKRSLGIGSSFDDILGKKETKIDFAEFRKKIPPKPTTDLLLFLMSHSPKRLELWEQDVLSVIRMQGRYRRPIMRTGIVNEGWASYVHMYIMEELFKNKILSVEDHGYYNLYNARVLAKNPYQINPYLLGVSIWRSIKERWDKGQHGEAWREAPDQWDWDLDKGLGWEKMLEVRKVYGNRFFIEDFLNEKVIEEADLYIYQDIEEETKIVRKIVERRPDKIKEFLLRTLEHSGVPEIAVVDGDYAGRNELYMRHTFNSINLDDEYRRRTMQHIYFLWNRPVHLETVVIKDEEKPEDNRIVLYSYNGRGWSIIENTDPYGSKLNPAYLTQD